MLSSVDIGTYPCEPKAPNSSTSSNTDVCGRWLYIPESSATTGISFVPSSLVLRSWWPQILKEEQKKHNNYKGTTHESACLCRDMRYTGTLESTKGNSSLLSALQTFQVLHIWTYAQLKHGLIVYNIFKAINAFEQLIWNF